MAIVYWYPHFVASSNFSKGITLIENIKEHSSGKTCVTSTSDIFCSLHVYSMLAGGSQHYSRPDVSSKKQRFLSFQVVLVGFWQFLQTCAHQYSADCATRDPLHFWVLFVSISVPCGLWSPTALVCGPLSSVPSLEKDCQAPLGFSSVSCCWRLSGQ